MKPKPMRSMNQLLGQVLGRVAADTGAIYALAPVWQQTVGELVSRHSTPLHISSGTLTVRCDGRAWCEALSAQAAELTTRLRSALGDSSLERLIFIVG